MLKSYKLTGLDGLDGTLDAPLLIALLCGANKKFWSNFRVKTRILFSKGTLLSKQEGISGILELVLLLLVPITIILGPVFLIFIFHRPKILLEIINDNSLPFLNIFSAVITKSGLQFSANQFNFSS